MSQAIPATMRAMVLHRPGEPLRLEIRPVPRPGPGQILLRVEACGVCRTDLHLIDGELPDPRLPIVPGHEIVGRVVALGEGVSGFTPDQRIGVPWLGWTCGSCHFCTGGRGCTRYRVGILLRFKNLAAATLAAANPAGENRDSATVVTPSPRNWSRISPTVAAFSTIFSSSMICRYFSQRTMSTRLPPQAELMQLGRRKLDCAVNNLFSALVKCVLFPFIPPTLSASLPPT